MRKSIATDREAYARRSIALRVAQEIAAIRVALKKHGYSLRKRPKQPVWTIIPPSSSGVRGETGRSYLLTYQPAPISSWVLYPQSGDRSRQTLLKIIQGAIAGLPAGVALEKCLTLSSRVGLPRNQP